MEKKQIYNILETQYFGDSPHESMELAGLKKLVNTDVRQIIDVGASLGQYTKAFALIVDDVPILAVEADPIRFERLAEHCARWQKSYGVQITPLHGAAADESGDCIFFSTQSNVSGATSQLSERSSTWTQIKVPAFRIDDLVSVHDHILVKMDIEGGEYSALQGAKKLLGGDCNQFLVELHVWGDGSKHKHVGDVLRIFKDNGYSISRYHGHYLFTKSGSPNLAAYLAVQIQYAVKRIVYFSPFRSFAIGLNRWLKG